MYVFQTLLLDFPDSNIADRIAGSGPHGSIKTG